MNLKDLVEKTARSALPYLGAGIMIIGGASMQSCSMSEYTTKKAKLEIVGFAKDSNKYISVGIQSLDEEKLGYSIQFDKPQTEKIFTEYNSGKIVKVKVKKTDLEKGLEKIKSEGESLFILTIPAKLK
jgi:hypothetical protein